MNELKEYTEKLFEDIKHIDEKCAEYWLARELMEVLEYKEWRKFNKVIEKVIEACDGSNYCISKHFVLKDKLIGIANLFRICQTEQKLKKENIKLKE